MLIDIQRVSKTYHLGDVPVVALRDVSLTIKIGEFIGICGPSGSGKTTLLNIIGTIDTQTSGKVIYKGKDISTLCDDDQTTLRNKEIGFIFQTFNLVPVLTALENIMLPLGFREKSSSAVREIAMNSLKSVGLECFVNHSPNKLSGGQRQRVAIARALALHPSLIIADEPTANLDSENALQILGLMNRLNEEKKITFIFSTHDSRLLERVRRVIRIEDGRIVKDGIVQ
jgi:putative ABC transport system ATP-binding protein